MSTSLRSVQYGSTSVLLLVCSLTSCFSKRRVKSYKLNEFGRLLEELRSADLWVCAYFFAYCQRRIKLAS